MIERQATVEEQDVRAPAAQAPPVAMSAPVAQVLQLQRSSGNAAVSRMLAASVARQPADAPEAESRIAHLAEQAGSALGLRNMLAAEPGLGAEITAYFAAGNEDSALNALMGQAFAPVEDAQTETSAEKNPTDPKVKLPPDITGSKTLNKGDMSWTLKAETQSSARVDIDFLPDPSKVEAKTISFGQTVINKVGAGLAYAGGTPEDPAVNKAKFQPFEEAGSKKRMDHLVDSENDPFYGAEWDQANKRWKKERAEWNIGSSHTEDGIGIATGASMFDTPGTPWAREGKGDVSIEFETVPMVLETREPLGSLLWGYKVKDEENAPIELTGGKDADCTDTPSADWAKTMDQFYAAKFAEILDDFEIAKADLKPDHKAKLDNIVTKMNANPALQAQLGGAADLTGDAEFNQKLSLKRAENARDYLVDKGIDAARLEVQSYGADWARVEAEAGKSEGKNRRVQIWVH